MSSGLKITVKNDAGPVCVVRIPQMGIPGPTGANTPHASNHNAGGSDALAIDAAAATGSLRTLGTGAQQAAAGNDSRLSDARMPTSHTHPSTELSDSTATGRSLITAASAAAAAPIVLPDNTLLGFPGILKIKEYAVADLPAPANVGKASAWCTDCLTPNGTGGPVFSDGTKWRLLNGLEATTDALTYCRSYYLTQSCKSEALDRYAGGNVSSSAVVFPGFVDASNGGSISSVGIGATAAKYLTLGQLTTGTSATGRAGMFAFYSNPSPPNTKLSFWYAACDLYLSNLSNSSEEFWFQLGFQIDSGVTLPPAYFSGLLYDRANLFGHNAGNSNNWYGLHRSNSTNVNALDSGIAPQTAEADIQRIEVLLSNSAVRFFINGSEIAGSPSANAGRANYPYFRIIKTVGTTARLVTYGRVGFLMRSATLYT